MKRTSSIILLSVTGFFTLSSMQCGRDYTCQCEGGLTGKPEPMTVQATKKKNAEKECAKYNNPPGTPDGFHDCVIK